MTSQYMNLDGDLEGKQEVGGTRIMDKDQKESLVTISLHHIFETKHSCSLFMKN